MNSNEVYKLLEKKFAAPAWALFPEVGNGTGANCNRHADAIAVSLWPSRGLLIYGFEIKCFRSDWLKELANPVKAESIQQFCDRWWIVLSDESIIREGELPPTWGLYVVKNGKLICKKDAPPLQPKPLNISFVAAVFRRQAESLDRRISNAYSEGWKEGNKLGIENGPIDVAREKDRYENKIKNLEKSIEEFEKKSGLKINNWDAGNIGETVARLMRARFQNPINNLKRAKEIIESLSENIEQQISIFENIELNREINDPIFS